MGALRALWYHLRSEGGAGGRSIIVGTVVAASIIAGGYAVVAPDEGGAIVCKKSNFSEWGPTYEDGECVEGGDWNSTNAGLTCNNDVDLEAGDDNDWPIVITVTSTINWTGAHALRLEGGCEGDGDPDTIDIILKANGNGSTIGISGDVLKFAPFGAQGPAHIQITGFGECGDTGGHFDFFQNQAELGTDIDIVGMTSGDYDAGRPTCQAAGGMLFWSETGDIDVLGGEYIGCNHGLNGNAAHSGAGSTVTDAKFRTGDGTGDPVLCSGVVISDACINTTGMTLTNVTSQRWNGTSYANSPCTG